MSAVCPQGHTSTAEDYCDTCGAPIEAASMAPPAPAPAPAGGGDPQTCPNCGFSNGALALFCENCGYDFTTGTAPAPVEADPQPASGSVDPGPAPGSGAEPDPGPDPDPAPDPASSEEPDASLPTPPIPGATDWVVEVWIDPDWYEAQSPEDPMPSPGSPQVIPLRDSSVLVGRPSASRGIRPQVDAGSDTGVSRRHCQLTTDGQRWWVEDLDSSNGTFVSPAGERLPSTPLEVGVRHELAEGERILIGGWTRLVVRPALPGEV